MSVPPDKSETSPDGRLRADFTCTSHAGGAWVETPSLVDVLTGRTLLSLAPDWHAQVFWGEPGQALLHVRHHPGPARIWRVAIDADREEARIDEGAAMPLARLCAALGSLLEPAATAGDRGPADRSETSPDGRLRVDYFVSYGLMSHEIESPELVDVPTGERLFALGSSWSATARFGPEGVVTFDLRNYPDGATTIEVVIDARRREGRVDGQGPLPLEALPAALRRRYEQRVPAASGRRAALEKAKGGLAIAVFIAVVIAVPFLLAEPVRRLLSSPAPAAKPLATVPKPTPTPPIPDYRDPANRGRPKP